MSLSAAASAASVMTSQRTRIGQLVGTLLMFAYSAWAIAAVTGHGDSPLDALVNGLAWADAPTTDVETVQSWIASRHIVGLLGALVLAPLGVSARQGILVYGGLLLAGEVFGLWGAASLFLLTTAAFALASIGREDGSAHVAWLAWSRKALVGGVLVPFVLLLVGLLWLTEAYARPTQERGEAADAAETLAEGHSSVAAMPPATAAKVLTLSMAASRDARCVNQLISETELPAPRRVEPEQVDPQGPVFGN